MFSGKGKTCKESVGTAEGRKVEERSGCTCLILDIPDIHNFISYWGWRRGDAMR